MYRQFQSLRQGLLSLLYPDSCVVCNDEMVEGEHILCTTCLVKLPYTNYHLERINDLRTKLDGKVKVNYTLAYLYFHKGESVQKLIYEMKYFNRPEIAYELGRWYARRLKNDNLNLNIDYIIAVPLHKRKLRKRGFNQSLEFAKGVNEIMNIPIAENVLFKTKNTQTQTLKTRFRRWSESEEVYVVKDELELIKDKDILLVDDIITTGSTIEICGNKLLDAGAASISVMSIADAR